MKPLFYYLYNRDFNSFKNYLDSQLSKPTSSSTGKSASWSSQHHANEMKFDINDRDDKGNSVLHLLASFDDQLQLTNLVLEFSNVNINLQDFESGWTPLHKSLYYGNIKFARVLLNRDDLDLSLKDREGYVAFDIYNLTINDITPNALYCSRSEFYTWGTNRNYVLGNKHGNDRHLPEKIFINQSQNDDTLTPFHKFKYQNIIKASMSKLHSGIVTDENENNVYFCGFGSGGRLGKSTHTQIPFDKLSSDFNVKVKDISLAQDHTMILTDEGHVYTFGLNRYFQLGYASVDAPSSHHAKFATTNEPIQFNPKRIVGILKKEIVVGISAGKCSSACWNNDSLFTWGTNEGHLG